MPTELALSDAAVEQGTLAITVSFTDETGAAVTPNTGLKWSLVKDDRLTVVNSRENVTITPDTSVTIVLSGADLAMDANQLTTWRYLVIEGTYNGALGSNLPIKDHLRFPVQDIAKVT